MIVIICGSRGATREDTLKAIESAQIEITMVISGGSSGPDTYGDEWAKDNGIKRRVEKANWDDLNAPGTIVAFRDGVPYNKKAGSDRNRRMAELLIKEGRNVATIAVWDGESKGTKDMMEISYDMGIPVYMWQTKNKTGVWVRRGENRLWLLK